MIRRKWRWWDFSRTFTAPAPIQQRFTAPDAPRVTQASPVDTVIDPEAAPLPLSLALETPIDQFAPVFVDVSRDHWAYEAVTRLYYGGIVSGYADTSE